MNIPAVVNVLVNEHASGNYLLELFKRIYSLIETLKVIRFIVIITNKNNIYLLTISSSIFHHISL